MTRTIIITRDERDQLRRWVEDLEGVLGDLQMLLLAGRTDEVAELRDRLEFGFGILDEIGWERQGPAERYEITVTPRLTRYISTQRQVATEQAEWEAPSDDLAALAPGVDFDAIAIAERREGVTEKGVAERLLSRLGGGDLLAGVA